MVKKLIEGAKKKDDVSIDIDDLMKSINTEFPKNAVPKETYNDTLQKTIKAHDDTIKTLKSNSSNLKKEYALNLSNEERAFIIAAISIKVENDKKKQKEIERKTKL